MPTCRKPKSRGCEPCAAAWRWALVVATAVTILLCINQQFSLRFFIGYTQLNTEYFYLLIALMLPFTFLIFPGTESAPLDRIPWYDILLFRRHLRLRHSADAQRPQGGGSRLGIRRRADARSSSPASSCGSVLMEALRRTGGWSLLLSVLPFTVYPLFADAKWLGPFRGTAIDARTGNRPITCCRAKACSAFRSRPLPTP